MTQSSVQHRPSLDEEEIVSSQGFEPASIRQVKRGVGLRAWIFFGVSVLLFITTLALTIVGLNKNQNPTPVTLVANTVTPTQATSPSFTWVVTIPAPGTTPGDDRKSGSATAVTSPGTTSTPVPATSTPLPPTATTTPVPPTVEPATPSGWSVYRPTGAGFSLALPANWRGLDSSNFKKLEDPNGDLTILQEWFDQGTLKFFAYSDNGFLLVESENLQPGNMVSLDKYTDDIVSQVKKSKLTKLVTRTRIKLSGGEVNEVSFSQTYTTSSGKRMEVTTTMYIMIKNGTVYVFIFGVPATEQKALEPTMNKIVGSFQEVSF